MDEVFWSWAGSRWWKFDFHTHTPASDDYGKGPHQEALRGRSPREWLLDYMGAEIDCVAVTDHNTGAWIDCLKEELTRLREERPPGYRSLTLFPGVEISAQGGVHILAILDGQRGTHDIDRLLGRVGYQGREGSCEDVTEKAVGEVIEAINGAYGIAIPAHVDRPRGLFQELQGVTLDQVLQCPSLFAAEFVEPDYSKPQAYMDRKLAWAEILGSDSHHPPSASRHLNSIRVPTILDPSSD